MLWILLVLACVILDQGVKYIIINNLKYGQFIPVIDNFFYITYWENYGAAWGILQNNRVFLISITVLALCFLIYLFKKSQSVLAKVSTIMIIGGALGNFVDRTFKGGGVVDFLHFRFGTYEYPAFNIADMLIVIGTGILIIANLIESKENLIETKENH
jgi:signal peptidase II